MRVRWSAILLAGLVLAGGAAGCGAQSPRSTTANGASSAGLPPPTTTISADASQTPVSTGTTPICASHATAATVSVSHQPAPVCLVTGTRLTVTFDKTHAAIGTPGPWGVPRVQVQPRILTIRSTVAKGPLLTAHLVARTRGIAIVRAGFNQECSIGDTTPCTIPPQAILTLDVTVVPKRH